MRSRSHCAKINKNLTTDDLIVGFKEKKYHIEKCSDSDLNANLMI